MAACSPGGGTTTLPTTFDTFFPLADGDTGLDVSNADAPTTEVGPDTAADSTSSDGGAPDVVGLDATGVPCQAGSPCDDGNNCTINDQCVGGFCQGSPLDCGPDDGLPCTSNACQDGACVVIIAAGFCAIDGACWTAGQPNPLGGCEACDPTKNATTWTGDGAACDDGDPCTQNDACVPGGGCAGTPIQCPPLSNAGCAVNQCVGGVCQAVSAGEGGACDDGDPCTIGETCTGGVCGGGSPKDSDMDGAIDQACGGDDCNDGTNQLSPLLPELCSDLLDNDCDGNTDAADSDCDTPAPNNCSYHTDCYPDVCAEWPGTGQNWCSTVCAGDQDCAAGQVCSKLPGSLNVGFCRVPVPSTQANGTACSDASQCASSICLDNVCTAECLNEASCPGGSNTCGLIGDPAAGYVASLCSPNGSAFPNQQQCLLGNEFNPAVCASGHCDLMNNPPVGPLYCSPICKTTADCGPGQECDVVFYADAPNSQALLYDPIIETAGTNGQKNPRDGALGCYTRVIQGGTFPDGQVCNSNSQCLGGRCMALLPGNPTEYCTRFCSLDTDCGAGMACKIEMVTMVSDFLQNFDTIPTDAWSYVRICKFE